MGSPGACLPISPLCTDTRLTGSGPLLADFSCEQLHKASLKMRPCSEREISRETQSLCPVAPCGLWTVLEGFGPVSEEFSFS